MTSEERTPAPVPPAPIESDGRETTPRGYIEAALRAPVVTPLVFAACLVILVAGLRLSTEILGPLFLVITLAILFTPLLRWPSGADVCILQRAKGVTMTRQITCRDRAR
jgi:hypothetical protein